MTETSLPHGLTVQPEFVSAVQESDLIQRIEWMLQDAVKSKDRRSAIVRFGYDYREQELWIGDAPEWLSNLVPELESVTVNQYKTGDSILPHVDMACFGDTIKILSLGSPATMRFLNNGSYCDVDIPSRSLTLLNGEARYDWKHAILPTSGLRYSVVYRRRVK